MNPIKIDDLGVPLFQETSTSIASVLPLGDMPPIIDGQVRSYQWLLVDKLLNTPNIASQKSRKFDWIRAKDGKWS